MKKTQILAVLALAMALGVVAPLTIVSGANATVKEETDKEDGEATKTDGIKFINNVLDSKAFKAFEHLDESLKKKPTKTLAVYATSIVNAYNKVKVRGAENLAAATLEEALSKAVLAQNVENYNDYSVLVSIIDETYVTETKHSQVEALAKFNELTAKYYIGAGDFEDLDEYAKIAAFDTDDIDNYDDMEGLVNAINAGQKAQDWFDGVKAALTDVDENTTVIVLDIDKQKTIDDIEALANNVKATDVYTRAYTPLAGAAFSKLMNGKTDSTKAGRQAIYAALKGYVDEVSALWNKSGLTVTKIVANSYSAGEEQKDPADKNEDLEAPNTGILSTAEGSAATISIVAGLTTALTALGAGVVAYRNARRSE